jgi:hypothetical protein
MEVFSRLNDYIKALQKGVKQGNIITILEGAGKGSEEVITGLIVTPIIKSIGRGGSVTTLAQSQISSMQREVFRNSIKCESVSPFPDSPSDGGVDRSFLVGMVVRELDIRKVGEHAGVKVLVEEVPNFLGLRA